MKKKYQDLAGRCGAGHRAARRPAHEHVAQKLPNTVPSVISTTSATNGISIAAIARSK